MAAVHPIPSFLQLPIDGVVDEAEPQARPRPRDAALARGGSLRLTYPIPIAPHAASDDQVEPLSRSAELAGGVDRAAAIACWRAWLQAWDIDVDPAPVLDPLIERLGDSRRHFRNLERVAAELTWLDEWRDVAHDPIAVGFAIWFRYAALDTSRCDNEAHSAEFARTGLAGLNVDAKRIRRIRELIVSTREAAPLGSPDAKLLADIGRARLADSAGVFDAQEEALRAESGHVVDVIYWRRRIAAIRAMHIKPRVYRTDIAHDRLEAAARDNLSRRLEAR